MPTALHWFRRDLRLRDNRALELAGEGGRRVVCAFVLDQRILDRPDTGVARVRYLLASLAELDATLRTFGAALVLRHGDPVAEITALAREVGADRVTAIRDHEPFARDRDDRVDVALRLQGGPGLTLTDEQEYTRARDLVRADGRPYVVFTPFRRRFEAILAEEGPGRAAIAPTDRLVALASLPRFDPVPSAAALGFASDQTLVEPGERAAEARLARFIERIDGLARYAVQRDRPDLGRTSQVSADLRFGTLSVRACLRAALELRVSTQSPEVHRAVDLWISQLAWRDFYAQVLWHAPRVEHEPFREDMRDLPTDADPGGERYSAWEMGVTGYPIVDAAMRQLRSEAALHNRCRMIVASFLTKDLQLDYRLGERYFMRMLADGNVAANNGGWQWTASTGTDPQPYFRILSPILQGQRFDPDGTYVKRWIPALARVPATLIHTPWLLSPLEREECGLGHGAYPAPVVDHAIERRRALERYAGAVERHRRGTT